MSEPWRVGPWQVRSTRIAYENAWITLSHHEVTHPNGAPGIYGVVGFRNRAVGVLPIRNDGLIPLVGQHRFPVDRFSWELPEGGGPLDEAPLAAARRELSEETGYTAGHWHELVAFDVSNSVTDETAVGFLAWGLKPGRAAPEDSEELTVKHVDFPQLLSMCLDGTIRDSLTLVMTLTAGQRAQRGELPPAVSRLIEAG